MAGEKKRSAINEKGRVGAATRRRLEKDASVLQHAGVSVLSSPALLAALAKKGNNAENSAPKIRKGHRRV